MRRRMIGILLVITLVMSVLATGGSAYAAENTGSVDRQTKTVTVPVGAGNYVPQSAQAEKEIAETAANLPSKLDLRNYNGKNYVTPVKLQNPFASCWAFSVAGAAEISYLYAKGLGVSAGQENNQVDFSEKYINWFTYHGITAADVKTGRVRASQIGEGYDISAEEKSDSNAAYWIGGYGYFALQMFGSGFGPVDEHTKVFGDTPFVYRGKNSWLLSDRNESAQAAAARKAYYLEAYRPYINTYIQMGYFSTADEYEDWFDSIWQEGYGIYDVTFSYQGYASYDDWSIPVNANYRLAGDELPLKNGNILPSPASSDGGGNYQFDETGVAAIKSELAAGHGITIGLYADQSMPNQKADDQGYMNTTNWAQFCGDKLSTNHSVVIVGYDDNYAKENFTRKVNGVTVKNSTPPANGAFICKNSWGAVSEKDKKAATVDAYGNTIYQNPNAGVWGVNDTGYFYLSYYDHTIEAPISFEFDTPSETTYSKLNYDQYDLMATTSYERMNYVSPVKMANIFNVEQDATLAQIAYQTTVPQTTVQYEIYRNVKNNNPSSGTLLEKGEVTHPYGGSHRISLKGEYLLDKGETYAIVLSMRFLANTRGDINYYENFALMLDTTLTLDNTGVINRGESFLYVDDKWKDLADFADERIDQLYGNYVKMLGSVSAFLKLVPGGKSAISIDNYPIKGILIPVGGGKGIIGDVDDDGDVTIVDATLIQRHLAELPTSAFNAVTADCDEDGDVTIVDATAIQRHLAELPTAARVGESV